MNNSIFVFLFFLFAGFSLTAQKTNPVSWDFKLEKVSSDEYKLVATAFIAPMWALYSQFTDPEGPVPTSFIVNGQEVRFTEESKAIREIDKIFEVEVQHFKNQAVFSTLVSKSKGDSLKGSVEFMTCDGLKCLPPTKVLFDLKF